MNKGVLHRFHAYDIQYSTSQTEYVKEIKDDFYFFLEKQMAYMFQENTTLFYVV